MNSRERVLRAFGKSPGLPDRPPLQFDLCRSLTDAFGRKLGIAPEYSLSYYEDLTYRISANAIRTALGSDCVVVGGTVRSGFVPLPGTRKRDRERVRHAHVPDSSVRGGREMSP